MDVRGTAVSVIHSLYDAGDVFQSMFHRNYFLIPCPCSTTTVAMQERIERIFVVLKPATPAS
jgi:hypothetical protein